MLQERVQMEVGKGLRLDKLLARLDKTGPVERGFFKSVLKGRQGVTLLLNGERLDITDAKKTDIREGDDLAILSPITGG
jgi:sulfur carrier protein ThiS